MDHIFHLCLLIAAGRATLITLRRLANLRSNELIEYSDDESHQTSCRSSFSSLILLFLALFTPPSSPLPISLLLLLLLLLSFITFLLIAPHTRSSHYRRCLYLTTISGSNISSAVCLLFTCLWFSLHQASATSWWRIFHFIMASSCCDEVLEPVQCVDVTL